jgi:hypothetical protein
LRIELDIFSGRPNPDWELQEASAAALQSIIDDASPSPTTVDAPGLGYRGFIVYGREAVRIYRGHISGERTGSQNRLANVGSKLDLWLLELGRTHLDPALYEACVAAIQGR